MEKPHFPTRRQGVQYQDSTVVLSSMSDLRNASGEVLSSSLQRTPHLTSILSVNDSAAPLQDASESVNSGAQHHCQELIMKVLHSVSYTAASVVCIGFSFYGDDIRVLFAPKEADSAFAMCFLLVFGLFFLDIILQSIGREGYFLSWSWSMDVAATLTVLVDVHLIWENALKDAQAAEALKYAGIVARLSARSRRVIDFIRLLRLLRVSQVAKRPSVWLRVRSTEDLRRKHREIALKKSLARKVEIYKSSSNLKETAAAGVQRVSIITTQVRNSEANSTFTRLYNSSHMKSVSDEVLTAEIPEESEVSRLVIGRIISIMFGTSLLLTVASPLFSEDFFLVPPCSPSYGLRVLDDLEEAKRDTQAAVEEYATAHSSGLSTLVRLYCAGEVAFATDTSPADLRTYETDAYSSKYFEAVFDSRGEVHLLAWMDVLKVTFTAVLLMLCTNVIFQDFSTTVIFGLERMVTFVVRIAQNPLELLRSSERMSAEVPVKTRSCCCHSASEYSQYEMKLLEDAIRKIGVMLVLGFGTAGSEIITQNMGKSGYINPLIHGKKIYAAFAFITIENFGSLASILHEDIMVYVNTVSLIVHSVCEKYQGMVNRNLGESIIVVWKFKDDDLIKTGNNVRSNAWAESVRQQTGLALLSAVGISLKLARSVHMTQFRFDTRVQAKIPQFSNKLTIGLHVGWGVEGPVGSLLKIDATYISPDVNLASRLESATRLYGVHVLASEKFVSHLDDEIESYMRHVDTVRFKGSVQAMKIFSFDFTLHDLGQVFHLPSKVKTAKKQLKVRQAMEFRYFKVAHLFSKSEKIKRIRSLYTQAFFSDYDSALKLYLAQDWQKARKLLERSCLKALPFDGPTKTLLEYMRERGFRPPADWVGVRALDTK